MSKQVIKNYSFNAGSKTITLTDFSAGQPVRLDRLALITDVTTNQVLYNFADPSLTTASVSSNNVITLSTLPGGVQSSDALRIDYTTVTGDPTYDDTTSLTKLTDGTNTSNVLKGDGTAAGQNAQLTAPSYQTQTFSFNSVSAGPTYDVGNYASVSVQITQFYTGTSPTINFQTSNDGTNWTSMGMVLSSNGPGNSVGVTATTTGIFSGTIRGRYFRLQHTGAYTSGTTTGTIYFSTVALTAFSSQTNATISTALPTGSNTIGNVGSSSATGSAVPSNAFYLGAANNSGNLTGLHVADQDTLGVTGPLAAGGMTYNGTTWDRTRSASSASGTTGTGIPAAGIMGFDGTNYQRIKTDSNGNLSVNGMSDGTTTANNIAGDTGQNAQLVAGNRKEVTFSTSTSQAVASTDVSNYRWISVQASSIGTGSTNTFQISNDNVNWIAYSLSIASSGSAGSSSTAATTTNFYTGPLYARYFRINVSGITGGTTAGTIEFFAMPNTLQGLVTNTVGNQTPSDSFPANGNNIALPTVSLNSIYNGSTYERQRTASTAAGTTGTGVPAAGIMGFDGTNYQRIKTDTNGVVSVSGSFSGLSDGTNGANVLKSDGTAAGQNSLMTSRSHLSVPFSTTTAQAVATTDASNYAWVSVQINTQGTSSTVTYQESNDNVNWVNVNLMGVSAVASSVSTGLANQLVHGPINARYFRLNVTGITAGTTAGVVEFLTTPSGTLGMTVTPNGNWSVVPTSATGSAIPSNAFLMGLKGSSGILQPFNSGGVGTTAGVDGVLASSSWSYNGSLFERPVSANAGAGSTGAGIQAAGILGFDGTNYQRVKTDSSGVVQTNANAPTTSGGLSVTTGSIGATATAVKASAGQVYGWYFYNNNSVPVYVQFFNAATGSVTLGTTTPMYSLGIPAYGGANVFVPQGVAHSTAITVAITTTRAGSTSPTNTVDFNIYYV